MKSISIFAVALVLAGCAGDSRLGAFCYVPEGKGGQCIISTPLAPAKKSITE